MKKDYSKFATKPSLLTRSMEPIRELEQIEAMKEALLYGTEYYPQRNLFMFQLGINTGLRISDILWLTARDLRAKSHLSVRELKTNKARRFLINDQFRAIVDEYIVELHDNDYLFPSNRFDRMPISRIQAYRILRAAAKSIGLEQIGCHSLRKSFGYHHYKANKDIALLMMIFNHSNQFTTLRYIGVSQELMDDSVRSFFL